MLTTRTARWTLVVVVAVVALIAALVVALRDQTSSPTSAPDGSPRMHRDADTAVALAGPRQRADLAPCPRPGGRPGSAALRGVTVDCAADGSAVDVGPALAAIACC